MIAPATRIAFPAGDHTVSGLLLVPPAAHALLVYGHGAGAGMEHAFMEASAGALAERGVATLRYNFPYMEQRRGRPDPGAVLQETVRAAVGAASGYAGELPLFAGGKSMGGRMTSQAQSTAPLPGVRGLVFVGFPLHRPKHPATERAEHLAHVALPMLFLQGTRDEMADLELVRGAVGGLGARAKLHVVDGADHGFAVLKRSGRTGAEVLEEIADTIDGWVRGVLAESSPAAQ
jgi:uncharacterized protein